MAIAAFSQASVQAHGDALPLGDDHISNTPKRGYLFSCQQRFAANAPGAQASGPWIDGGSWFPSLKPTVDGEIYWPGSEISISVEGDERVVRANNLPSHSTGQFPIARDSEAFRFDRNPNAIAEQEILLRLPADPQSASDRSCVPMGMIGFAVSGTAIYNALDAAGRDAPAHEIQDLCNGHPQQRGQYHYHNLSPCLTAASPDEPVGWMLDGFPILGAEDSTGRHYTNADLDECHGTVGPVTVDGTTRTMYHYRFTAEYPYTIGCFAGTPIATNMLGPRGEGRRPPPR